jgi:hypothetical protein
MSDANGFDKKGFVENSSERDPGDVYLTLDAQMILIAIYDLSNGVVGTVVARELVGAYIRRNELHRMNQAELDTYRFAMVERVKGARS